MFATRPRVFNPYKSGSSTKRDLTIDRGSVEATDEFVLTYYSLTPLPSIKPKGEIGQIRRESSKIRRQSSRCCANLVLLGKMSMSKRGGRRRTRREGRGKHDRVQEGMMEPTLLNTLQHKTQRHMMKRKFACDYSHLLAWALDSERAPYHMWVFTSFRVGS